MQPAGGGCWALAVGARRRCT